MVKMEKLKLTFGIWYDYNLLFLMESVQICVDTQVNLKGSYYQMKMFRR